MTENIAKHNANAFILSLDDLVFENRNKEYGAYDLRKKYRRFVFIAFAVSFTVIVSAMVAPVLSAYYNKNKKHVRIEKNTTAVLENMNKGEEAPPPPPPPPPPPAAMQAQVAFVAPKVVDSVREEVEMKSADENIQTTVNAAPPVDLTPVVETKKEEVVEKEEPAFIVVEENATFKGGDLGAFRNDVQGKLVYPQQAAENGSEGRVFIQFAVNSHGDVCDVKVLRSAGDPLLDAEAVRVIIASPKWIPAKQSGSAVKQQFTIPITFKLQQ